MTKISPKKIYITKILRKLVLSVLLVGRNYAMLMLILCCSFAPKLGGGMKRTVCGDLPFHSLIPLG